jgi:hypothetical protein
MTVSRRKRHAVKRVGSLVVLLLVGCLGICTKGAAAEPRIAPLARDLRWRVTATITASNGTSREFWVARGYDGRLIGEYCAGTKAPPCGVVGSLSTTKTDEFDSLVRDLENLRTGVIPSDELVLDGTHCVLRVESRAGTFSWEETVGYLDASRPGPESVTRWISRALALFSKVENEQAGGVRPKG